MMRRALVLGLVGTFFLVVFVVRVALHRRRTGEWGVRGLSGRAGSAGWWGGVCFVAAGLCVPVALGGDARESPSVVGAGALAVLGLVITVIAQAQMRASWRIGVRAGEKTEFVTRGLFGVVRNPVFSGMVLFALGVVGVWPNAAGLLAAGLLVVGVELQVRVVEEPALRELHPAAWTSWARRVGRFVPLVGRASPCATTSGPPRDDQPGDPELHHRDGTSSSPRSPPVRCR